METDETSPRASAAPRPASTVMLLRDGPAGLETLMVTRNVASDFASGALVFPGGRVDAADAEAAMLGCCRLTPGMSGDDLPLRIAGIRETWEEAHILLARKRGADTILSARELDALERELRDRLGRVPLFADIAAAGNIELATDLMVPFAHWITPQGMPKRYDTHFFLAAAPIDQVVAHDGHEAVDNIWIGPSEALAGAETGRFTIVFPTRLNLMKLGRSATLAAAIEDARGTPIVTVCPEIVPGEKGPVLRIPIEAGYGIAEAPAGMRLPRSAS
jgi:8-oxo-dGTP pyrophosphatase MutT (NUDIX family)